MKGLAHILEAVWPRVRAKHLYPELPFPDLAAGKDQTTLDLYGKRISLGEGAVRNLAGRMPAESAIEALLDHGVAHHLYCPWNLAVHLTLYAEAKQVLLAPAIARRATDAFMDMTADTYCISRVTSPLPELYRSPPRNDLEAILQALRQELWQTDLGAESHLQTAQRLARIAYLDPPRWPAAMRRFALLVQPYLKTDKPQFDPAAEPITGGHLLHHLSRRDIEHGLRQLAENASTPLHFNDIVKDFEAEIGLALNGPQRGVGRGAGSAGFADISFYMKRAEAHRLPIRSLPMKKSGALYPHHHVAWEAGSPCHDIDPWVSFGKTMPGISKTWQRAQGTVFDHEMVTPDCMVLIDSSSSMPHPRRHLSFAVLGAGCACDAYLRNGARVAVYNFSDAARGGKLILPYTEDRAAVYRVLCCHLGGGTHLDLDGVRSLQTEPPPDIFLITDMQIANLDPVITFLETCPNRITAVHIGSSVHAARFRRRVDLRANVAIFPCKNAADIPRIVLGRVRQHFMHSMFGKPMSDAADPEPAGATTPGAAAPYLTG